MRKLVGPSDPNPPVVTQFLLSKNEGSEIREIAGVMCGIPGPGSDKDRILPGATVIMP